MAEASYASQLLATHAAGYINGAGTTIIAFGCSMTRLADGQYAVLLDASAGLVDDVTYTQATPKGAVAANAVVQDFSDREKRIFVTDSGGSEIANDVEIIVYKAVTSVR